MEISSPTSASRISFLRPAGDSAMRTRLSLVVFALALTASWPLAQTADTPEYGPAKGTLLIVGGGNLSGSGINEKFVELAGGKDKNFVILPTAGRNPHPHRSPTLP